MTSSAISPPRLNAFFDHLQADPQLSAMELLFHYGLIDKPSSRAVAKFASEHSARAVVWVTAATQLDGT